MQYPPQYQQPVPPADPMSYVAALEARIRALEARLPNTSVVAPSFMKRAFAIWGHAFVANFVISLIAGIIGFVLSLVFAGGIMSMLQNAQFQ